MESKFGELAVHNKRSRPGLLSRRSGLSLLLYGDIQRREGRRNLAHSIPHGLLIVLASVVLAVAGLRLVQRSATQTRTEQYRDRRDLRRSLRHVRGVGRVLALPDMAAVQHGPPGSEERGRRRGKRGPGSGHLLYEERGGGGVALDEAGSGESARKDASRRAQAKRARLPAPNGCSKR